MERRQPRAQGSPLDQARTYMADGDPHAGCDALTPHESSLAGAPRRDDRLGIAAMDGGHLTPSVSALERLLAVQPENGLVRAEIARVYLMRGEVRTSQHAFETVSKGQKRPRLPCLQPEAPYFSSIRLPGKSTMLARPSTDIPSDRIQRGRRVREPLSPPPRACSRPPPRDAGPFRSTMVPFRNAANRGSDCLELPSVLRNPLNFS